MNRDYKLKWKILLTGIIMIMLLLTASDIKKEDELTVSENVDKWLVDKENIDAFVDVKDMALPDVVNVVLTNDNHQQAYRSNFQIKTASPVTVIAGDTSQQYGAQTVFTKEMLAGLFTKSNVVTIMPQSDQSLYLLEADTGNWSAAYRGIMFVYKSKDSYWIVNQLPLESYLLGVVPGEMPERFSLEALKAQAVCARTYACNMIRGDAYKEYNADVDDSVECQVYNKHGENSKASQAVGETKGIVLLEQSDKQKDFQTLSLADIYYFSTSCGFTTDLKAWGEKSLPYLKSVSTLLTPEIVTDWDIFLKRTDVVAYDSGSNYFRWTANIAIPEGYTLSIDKRDDSGIVTKISLKSTGDKRVVTTENEIRDFLGNYIVSLVDSAGVTIEMDLLPSAWFAIEQHEPSNEYVLYGGGYGHGIGMSQYGAHGMAEQGMDYEHILQFYFPGTKLNQ